MSSSTKLQFIVDERARLEREGLLINIRTIGSPQGAWIVVDGKKVLNLCSNNYLGFANHPKLKEAAAQAIESFGVGPAAVRTIAGNTVLHTALEEKLARFKGVEAAIAFQSGFNSNVATIPSLVGKGDLVFSDELNHASIIDGCRLSGADIIRYGHCNPASLEQKLSEHYPAGSRNRALVITDGVFSMDGDIAPLPPLVESRGALRRDGHGRRCAWRGGARQKRSRCGRPFSHAWAGRCRDRDSLEGVRGRRRLCGREERSSSIICARREGRFCFRVR